MAMFNYQGNVKRRSGVVEPRSTPLGGTSGGRSLDDIISIGGGYSQSAASDAEAAREKSYDLYDTRDYQTEMSKRVPGLKYPSTYGTDPSKLGKTTKLSDIYKEQGGTPSSGGSSGGGGVVSGGGTTATAGYDYNTIKSVLDKGYAAIEERNAMSLQNWEDAIANVEAEIAQLESSYAPLRSTYQSLLGKGLTETQKAAVGSEMRGIEQSIGQSALASGFAGSGKAGSEIAAAKGVVAASMADIIRQNQLEALAQGTATESAYQGERSGLTSILEQIRPADIQLPDYMAEAELLGRAAASGGTGTSSTSGTWRRVGSRDVTKEGRGLRWEYVTPEQMAKEQEARDAGYTSLYQYELAQQREAYRESLRAKARAKGKNI